MKVTLYAATSIDGYIATPDGNSDWVADPDTPHFEGAMKRAGCIIVGRKTFEQYEKELYPVEGVLNIVMTSNPRKENKYDNVVFTDAAPADVLKLAGEKGHKEVLLVGGGTMNGSFIDAGLVDEIVVDIHPLVLGKGIKVFECGACQMKCEKISVEELDEGLVLIRYKIVK